MTEKEKMLLGVMYIPDEELINEHKHSVELCINYNNLSPSKTQERRDIIKRLFGSIGENFTIEPNIMCDYGYNISVGENFFINYNSVFLDTALISIGDNAYIGPNCSFYTACHPIDPIERNKGLEYSKPITIGDNVWLGGNVTVLAGVKIGDNVVIGAGSVVTKNIPSNCVAYGNPCKKVKEIK